MVSGANGRPKAASRMDIPMLSLGSGAVSRRECQAQAFPSRLCERGRGGATTLSEGPFPPSPLREAAKPRDNPGATLNRPGSPRRFAARDDAFQDEAIPLFIRHCEGPSGSAAIQERPCAARDDAFQNEASPLSIVIARGRQAPRQARSGPARARDDQKERGAPAWERPSGLPLAAAQKWIVTEPR
jgi:hypothetical protein